MVKIIKPFRAVMFAPGAWEIRCPDGSLIYDGASYGNDRPLIFRDEDAALDFAERCNINALETEDEA